MQKLSKRLYTVASLVHQDATVFDVGTDHGYIPVYLIKNKIINKAIAGDINEGPLLSCKGLVAQEGLEKSIKTVISNGLENVDDNEYDTIIIAGMGGELVANILSKKDNKNKHLILNPMTHPEIVRKYLYDNGFEIINDLIIKDGKHYYNVMDSKYTGCFKENSIIDYYIGNITDFSQKEYITHLLNYLKNKARTNDELKAVIKSLENIYDNC